VVSYACDVSISYIRRAQPNRLVNLTQSVDDRQICDEAAPWGGPCATTSARWSLPGQASLDLKSNVKVNGLEIAIDCADGLRAVALEALAC